MLGFISFLIEKATAKSGLGNALNTMYADAYEMNTALHLHDNSAASKNEDQAYQAKMAELRQKRDEVEKKLGALDPTRVSLARKAALDSATAYMDSLSRQGVKPNMIQTVHHTNKGISDFLGRKVDRKSNPHDIMITHTNTKVNNGIHGTSLKATQGTASNTPIESFDRDSGIGTNLKGVWEKHLRKLGFVDEKGKGRQLPIFKSGDPRKPQLKALQARPDVIQAYAAAVGNATQHHATSFNNAEMDARRQHLLKVLKLNPDVPYDLTKGEKGGSSVPHTELPHFDAINNATNLYAVPGGGSTHFYDQDHRHIASVEHRATHGTFSALQANGKLGTLRQRKGI